MADNPFLSRRLIILTGKGGTGKTTVTAAIGLLAVKSGRRTLLVEVNAREDIPGLFGKKPHGYQEKELIPDLFSISIDPFKAMEEYLYLRLKMRFVVERIMQSPLYRYLSRATPGLRELATIGKVWHLCERTTTKGGKLKYDLVVLDAPSTGHGIPVLKLPQTAIEAIKIGPVVREAKKVQSFLSDRTKCGLSLVSIPEEMPVAETIEFFQRAKEELDIGMDWLFINMVLPEQDNGSIKNNSASMMEIKKVLDYFKRRQEEQQQYVERLMGGIRRLKSIKIPWLPTRRIGEKEIERIADILKEQIG
jgi:anion-transporting  ArsA/GET3 family ATPase